MHRGENHDKEIHKRTNHALRTRTGVQMGVQKIKSESSENVRKTTGFFTNSWRIEIDLESYSG